MPSDIVIKNLLNVVAGTQGKASAAASTKKFIQFTNFIHVTQSPTHTHTQPNNYTNTHTYVV